MFNLIKYDRLTPCLELLTQVIKQKNLPPLDLTNLVNLAEQFQAQDLIVVNSDLQRLQIESQLKQIPGIQVLPKFITLNQLFGKIIDAFILKINEQQVRIKKISPRLLEINTQLKNYSSSHKLINTSNLEALSVNENNAIWLTSQLLQQMLQAPEQNPFIANLAKQIGEIQDPQGISSALFFTAQELSSLGRILSYYYPELAYELMQDQVNYEQLLKRDFTCSPQEKPLLQGQLEFFSAYYKNIHDFTCNVLGKMHTSSFAQTQNIIITNQQAVLLLADSEFESSDVSAVEKMQRIFMFDTRVYNSSYMLILKKAAHHLNIEINYFVNTFTHLLFDTTSRRTFLDYLAGHNYNLDFSLRNLNYTKTNSSYNLLSLLGEGTKKRLIALLNHETYAEIEEEKDKYSEGYIFTHHLAYPIHTYDMFVELQQTDGFYPSDLRKKLTQVFGEVYNKLEQALGEQAITEQTVAQALLKQDLTDLVKVLRNPGHPSLLEQIKNSLQEYTAFENKDFSDFTHNHKRQFPGYLHLRGDDSLQVVRAHTARRELEYAMDFIQRELSQNPALNLSDFVVFTTHLPDYQALIPQVVPPEFAYQILSSEKNEQIVEVIQFIFTLSDNYLNIEQFKNWLNFACVQDFYQLNNQDLEFFTALLSKHQVNNEAGYNGKDIGSASLFNHVLPLHNQKLQTNDSNSIGNNFPVLNYNAWQHVFLRANLNNSFNYAANQELFLTTCLPQSQMSADYASISKLNSLLTDLTLFNQFTNSLHTGDQWLDFLHNLGLQFFVTPELERQFKQAWQDLHSQIYLTQVGATKVDKFIIQSAFFEALATRKVAPQHNSLTFANLTDLSGTSFKNVICLGLNANKFPGLEEVNTYDFTASYNKISTSPSLYQLSQLQVLELFNNTQNKLVLSYIGKNARDDELPQSSLLSDTLEFISNNLYLPTPLLPQQDNPELSKHLLSIFYSTPSTPSYLIDLNLGSFDLRNYGQNELQLSQSLDNELLAKNLLHTAYPSFNRTWLNLEGQAPEQEDFANFGQILACYKQVLDLSNDDNLLVYEPHYRPNSEHLTFTFSLRDLSSFMSLDTERLQETKIWQNTLAVTSTYGLEMSDTKVKWKAHKALEKLYTSSISAEHLMQNLYLEGDFLKTTLVQTKLNPEIEKFINQAQALEQIKHTKVFYSLKDLYHLARNADYPAPAKLDTALHFEPQTTSLTFKLEPAFIERCRQFFAEYSQQPVFAQLIPRMPIYMLLDEVEQKQQGNKDIYVQINVDSLVWQNSLKLELEDDKIKFCELLDLKRKPKVSSPLGNVVTNINNLAQILAACQNPQIQSLYIDYFISSEDLSKIQEFELPETLVKLCHDQRLVYQLLDLTSQRQSLLEAGGKALSQILSWFLVGRNLLLPKDQESFFVQLFSERDIILSNQENNLINELYSGQEYDMLKSFSFYRKKTQVALNLEAIKLALENFYA
ncbi:hypothetical protein CJP74_01980 [Psittacicella melopsittaci]|uniref:Exonuclease V subunit gamma n=1 Tax=Psittacicella melopsittaci TaxID=2028576 RepID=A0A3A1Y825_9GAMM|nr:exodeoxyribonuclease V subunit gamma [Psittacicella melopsittaci]RIY33379.1 hypothetical protein CJP74_01980 [Psittacicella melopsittaci]